MLLQLVALGHSREQSTKIHRSLSLKAFRKTRISPVGARLEAVHETGKLHRRYRPSEVDVGQIPLRGQRWILLRSRCSETTLMPSHSMSSLSPSLGPPMRSKRSGPEPGPTEPSPLLRGALPERSAAAHSGCKTPGGPMLHSTLAGVFRRSCLEGHQQPEQPATSLRQSLGFTLAAPCNTPPIGPALLARLARKAPIEANARTPADSLSSLPGEGCQLRPGHPSTSQARSLGKRTPRRYKQ